MEDLDNSDLLVFEVASGDWFGMGVWMHHDLNLMNYQNGHLNFRMRSTGAQGFEVGLASTNGGESWVKLSPNGDTFGLEWDGMANGTWSASR
ncbi:hypothetical protein [Microbulbifer epialgicus]|uniref:Uncharacterized protein n=1 Tax=Microbulbifer epialgicus TaxID=393907 RepID=A0ABV4P3G7_9GAMM